MVRLKTISETIHIVLDVLDWLIIASAVIKGQFNTTAIMVTIILLTIRLFAFALELLGKRRH